MARLTIDQFTSFFVWYKDLPSPAIGGGGALEVDAGLLVGG